MKRLVLLAWMSMTVLFAATAPVPLPAPAKQASNQPISISDLDTLNIQLQNQQLETVGTQFDKLAEEIKTLQAQQEALKLRYGILSGHRDTTISGVFTKLGVSPTDYNLDLDNHRLVSKSAAAAPAVQK